LTSLFVPMTKATGFGQLPVLLENWAGSHSVQDVFQKAGLPLETIEFPKTFIPVESMRDLFEVSAQAAGERCFGLSVGQDMTPSSFGVWLDYCAQAPTLAEGLRRAVACCAFHQSGGYLEFEDSAPVAFWRYMAPPGFKSRPIQHADHLIGPMIRFVQAFLGTGWNPEWVEVNYLRDPQANQMEQQLALPVRFGARGVGVAILASDLPRSTRCAPCARRTVTFGNVYAEETGSRFDEPIKSVFSAITLRLLEGQTDIRGAACTLGVGVQTLQRNLRREGVDYRDLLNRAKCHRARALLADTSLPVIDIAFSLGYADHANFSRAFKRMTGIPPATYRAAQKQGNQSVDPARQNICAG